MEEHRAEEEEEGGETEEHGQVETTASLHGSYLPLADMIIYFTKKLHKYDDLYIPP